MSAPRRLDTPTSTNLVSGDAEVESCPSPALFDEHLIRTADVPRLLPPRPNGGKPIGVSTVYASIEGGAEYGYAIKPLRHGAVLNVGNIRLKAIHTPGHTPEHMSYLAYMRGNPVRADAP